MSGTTDTAERDTGAAPGFGLGRLRQVALPVRDLARAVRFYREVLGVPFLFEAPPRMAFFALGEVRLLLGMPEGEADAGASVLYYAVDDIHAAHATLAARGAEFVAAPHHVATVGGREIWMAFLKDSEGNVLAVTSEKDGA